MKAVVVAGKGKVEIEEIPKPQVMPGTLLVKVSLCSICGSDIEKLYSPMWDEFPEMASKMKGAIFGHEWVGRIEEVGEGVEGWKPGDRIVDNWTSCGRCWYCRRGLSFLCLGGRTRGYPYDAQIQGQISGPPRWGALAEYVLKSATRAIRVPDTVSDEEASQAEPLATGVTSALHGETGIGDAAVIYGVGHIGLSVMAAVRATGAAPIIAIDKNDARLDMAKQVGADILLNPDKVDVMKEVLEITEAGPDAVFLCTSARATGVLDQAFEMVRYGGRIMIVGQVAPAELNTGIWMVKEVRVEGTVHMGESMIPAMRLLEYKRANMKPVVTGIFPIDKAQEAFDTLHEGKHVAVAVKP